MKSFWVGLAVVLCAGIFTLTPLFHEGIFSMHDDTQVGRVVAMGRAIRQGQFPVRWVSDLGYGFGYPIFNFYGPLPYYAGGLFYALGFPPLLATKLMIAIGIMASCVVMYVVSRRFFGTAGAVVAGVLYAYAPYHAVDVYVRGAVGEFWALIFIPLVLGAVGEAENKSFSNRFVVLGTAIGLFGIITSHTILGYVTVAFYTMGLFVFAFVRRKRVFAHRGFHALLAGLVLGLSLSAFFWLPAVSEMRYTYVTSQVGPTARYTNHFVCVSQLWSSAWGYAGSAPGCIDGMSYTLGKLHILLGVVGVGLWVYGRLRRINTKLTMVPLSIGVTIWAIFMMLPISLPLWKLLPNFSFVQYPWRFLAFAIAGLSLVGASVVIWFRPPVARIAVSLLIVLGSIGLYQKLFAAQRYTIVLPGVYESEEELRFRVSRISDEYLPRDIVRPKTVEGIVRDTIEKQESYSVRTVWDTDVYAKFVFQSPESQEVVVRKAYFPGWSYIVNGVRVSPRVSAGLPRIPIPKGDSTVEIRFGNTPIRLIGNALSIVAVAFILLSYGKPKKTNA